MCPSFSTYKYSLRIGPEKNTRLSEVDPKNDKTNEIQTVSTCEL